MRSKPQRFELSRRAALIGAASSVANIPAASISQPFTNLREFASGRVFEDQRGDGQRYPGDRGVAGVLISNGCDVVATDDDGRWYLQVGHGDHVFVVKPAHWSTSPAPGRAPGFAYLHQPLGSPHALQFAGVAPTAALPREIDFPLRRNPEDRNYNVALVADTQPSNLTELGYLQRTLIAPLVQEKVAFAINHGDVVGDDLSLFGDYVDLIGTTGIAWHHCPGNHDMNLDSPDGAHAFETWKRVFGPPHYAFQAGDATFIILNTVEYAGYPRPASDKPAYRGWVGPRQLAFVKNLLRHVPARHLIVVSMHIPLASYEDPGSVADTTGDMPELLKLLSGRNHSVSFSGHLHTTEHHYFGEEFGFSKSRLHHHQVLTAACGSWWSGPLDRDGIPVSDSRDGSPKGFHILSIDGYQYETKFVAAAREQMRVLITTPDAIGSGSAACGRILSSPIAKSAAASAQIVVDVFDGGPHTRVFAAIDDWPLPVPELTRCLMPDPYIVEAFADPTIVRPSWLRASPSSHMWFGSLPALLSLGRHRLTIRAVGEFGREHVTQTHIAIA